MVLKLKLHSPLTVSRWLQHFFFLINNPLPNPQEIIHIVVFIDCGPSGNTSVLAEPTQAMHCTGQFVLIFL